jgi:hypothetical protein
MAISSRSKTNRAPRQRRSSGAFVPVLEFAGRYFVEVNGAAFKRGVGEVVGRVRAGGFVCDEQLRRLPRKKSACVFEDAERLEGCPRKHGRCSCLDCLLETADDNLPQCARTALVDECSCIACRGRRLRRWS